MFSLLDVQFPTLSIPLTRGYEFTSTHARYEHEMAKITFIDWGPTYDSIAPYTPIVVNLRGIGSSRTFNGYVHHITPDISPDKNYVDIHLIGASYVFKQQSQRMWVNVTADQVIKDLAESNNFSYIVEPTERVYEQISQAEMTDWELMVSLAKQNGYSLKANNTTIIFQPLTKEFTDTRQEAAYLSMTGLETKATGIYSFKPMVGESIPFDDAAKATVSISGVDVKSVQDHSITNQNPITPTRKISVSPVFDSYQTRVVAPTYEIAQYEATAADERNRYAYRGEVVFPGNPALLPDSPVFLDGVGQAYSGYWTILSTEHYIQGQEYKTTAIVGTDSLGLSAKWTDNKNVSAPSKNIKRVITPGVRQKIAVSKTTLKKSGKVVKESLKTPLSKAKNQSKATVKAGPSHQWTDSGGNLKSIQKIDSTMSAVVRRKLDTHYGK